MRHGSCDMEHKQSLASGHSIIVLSSVADIYRARPATGQPAGKRAADGRAACMLTKWEQVVLRIVSACVCLRALLHGPKCPKTLKQH